MNIKFSIAIFDSMNTWVYLSLIMFLHLFSFMIFSLNTHDLIFLLFIFKSSMSRICSNCKAFKDIMIKTINSKHNIDNDWKHTFLSNSIFAIKMMSFSSIKLFMLSIWSIFDFFRWYKFLNHWCNRIETNILISSSIIYSFSRTKLAKLNCLNLIVLIFCFMTIFWTIWIQKNSIRDFWIRFRFSTIKTTFIQKKISTLDMIDLKSRSCLNTNNFFDVVVIDFFKQCENRTRFVFR